MRCKDGRPQTDVFLAKSVLRFPAAGAKSNGCLTERSWVRREIAHEFIPDRLFVVLTPVSTESTILLLVEDLSLLRLRVWSYLLPKPNIRCVHAFET